MNKHSLSLEIPDTLNTCILRVVDSSYYADNLAVDCARLSILVPGFTCAIGLDAEPGFCNWNITACDLNTQVRGCGTKFEDLPDGVYAISYSVSPNDYVYVEYNHLRITKALNQYSKLLCDLEMSACDPAPEVKKKLDKLRLIYSMLMAAKAKVEYCHNAQQGLDLYEYALKQLNKMSCKTC